MTNQNDWVLNMVKVKEDLTGRQFGRLVVIEQAEDYVSPNGIHCAQWLCECSCEEHTKKIVIGGSLRRWQTLSCGCISREMISERNKQNKKYNQYSELLLDEYGKYYIGYTTNTNKGFYVDADDFERVKNYTWYEESSKGMNRIKGYVDGKCLLMHQFLGFAGCDHSDRNELNNRKYNLRPCSFVQNRQNSSVRYDNTSGVIGVGLDKNKTSWRVRITINYQTNKCICYI